MGLGPITSGFKVLCSSWLYSLKIYCIGPCFSEGDWNAESYFFSAAEQHDACRLEEEFMSSVRLGQLNQIEQLVCMLLSSNLFVWYIFAV